MLLSQEESPRLRRQDRRLRIEILEDRVTPSWGSVPPSAVAVPSSFTTAALNAGGDAGGSATISANEVDWVKFTGRAGPYTFSATTPYSSLDTVLGVYNGSGQRVAYNDDVSAYNRDSRASVTLAAGTYYFGVTNYSGTRGGSYSWAVDGPTVPPPPVSPPPPPVSPPPPATSAFQITLGTTGMTASQQAVFQQAASRWSQVITGDLPNATYNGVAVDDVWIQASGAAIDGPGGTLGQAGPDSVRGGSYLPIHGTMQFDTADLATLEANGSLYSTILHEMGHVLGIGTVWSYRGLLSGAGTADPRFTGPQATAQYNALFGRNEASVPVENTGGAGTRDGHWRETLFGNEVMTGYLNAGANPLSRVTIASLADLGYAVNFAAADAYTPPAGAAVVSGTGSAGGATALVAAVVEPRGVGVAPLGATGGSTPTDATTQHRGAGPRVTAVEVVATVTRRAPASVSPFQPLAGPEAEVVDLFGIDVDLT